jgi:hypothetical protein
LGIGENAGQYLDKIRIKYLDNYTSSAQVEDSTAVIGVVAPGASIERFTSSQVQKVVGHTKVMEQVFTLTTGVETKALGEYIAKFSLPYTFFLLNVDMELNKNGQVFVQKML